jgi:rare lipoprotein A
MRRILPLVVPGCLMLAACNHNPNTNMASRGDAAHDAAAAPDEKKPARSAQRAQKAAVKTAARHDAGGAALKDTPQADGQESILFSTVGVASWYGADFHGRRTANGERYVMHALTAAHPTLPLSSRVRVTNLANQRSLIVRVNDRGPFVGARVIDVSAKTAQLLGFYDRGLAKVKVEALGRTPKATQLTASATP